MECSFNPCGSASKAKGLCDAHYRQQRRGQPLTAKREYKNDNPCPVAGCGKEAKFKGFCKAHYEAAMSGRIASDFDLKPCEVADCTLPKRAKGLCANHYNKVMIYKITPEEVIKFYSNPVCGNAQCFTTNRLHLDHDHKTGKVRGLLCGNCNTALGLLEESERKMFGLLNYMEKHRG